MQANKKTRNRAYDILVEIGHAIGDEDRGGNRENLSQIFNVVNVDFKFLLSIIDKIMYNISPFFLDL